uniref:G-protein coupled receptors family 1 profile domain-containing protein n=1 Tax=Cyprinus carpio TaxID=7962 RepID=A0A8C2EXF2_CYPCA
MAQLNNSSDVFNASHKMNQTDKIENAEAVFIWIVSFFGIPIICLTLFALCFLIKSHRAASVYVIHLILSDLLQIGFINVLTTELARAALWSAYKYCLVVGLFFMAFIAIERYILVSHPHWYRSHHSVKMSCFISLIIWLMPLTFIKIREQAMFTVLSQSLASFIPYPIILLCFVGTWRGLSHAKSLTSQKRKLILGSLSLVLLNYTFLILPLSISSLCLEFLNPPPPTAVNVYLFCHFFLYLNPLADCLLYLFMRRDAENIMKSLFSCRSLPQSIIGGTNSHAITS